MKYTTLFYSIFMLMLHASSSLKGMEDIEQQLAELEYQKLTEIASINNKEQRLSQIKHIQKNPYLFSYFQSDNFPSSEEYKQSLNQQEKQLKKSLAHHKNRKDTIEKKIDNLERKRDEQQAKRLPSKLTKYGK